MSMRRTDRQMDRDSAWQAVDACCFGTVSMLLPEGEPYCVPLSIARIGETLYFHCAQEVTDDAEKIRALRAICEKYTPENMSRFDAAIAQSLSRTGIWRIDVTGITGKCKK